MSQSPPGEVLNESYRQGWKDLTNLILSGESFSGNERNCAFLNTGGARFATASAASGFDFIDDGRALTTVDWDFDGDLDFWLTNRTAPRLRFLRNDYPTKNHFLVVGLEGVTVNRDAIGARVELLTKAASGGVEKQIRSLRAGEGFLGQSSKWIHFGLGSDSEIDRLVVRWPGASAEEFSGLSRDRFYRIVQGTGRAHRFEPPIQPQRLTRSTVKLPKRTVQSQTLLTSAIPVPDLPYFNFSGEAMKLSDVYGSDQPLLINLFASWCVPCVAELKAFSQSEESLRAAQLQVLALSLDGLGGGAGTPEQAREFLNRIQFPFLSGRATDDFLESLQIIHDVLFDARRSLPIPTSILLDRSGQLAALYRGPVEIDRVQADLATLALDDRERVQTALPFAGRWIAPPPQIRLVSVASDLLEEGDLTIAHNYISRYKPRLVEDEEYAGLLFDLGNRFNDRKLFKHAESFYRDAVKADPEYAKAYHALGLKLQEWGHLDEALAAYRNAVDADPNLSKPHFMLGLALVEQSGERKLEEAIVHFRSALRLEPDYLYAHFYLGMALEQSGRQAEALPAYREALRIDPRFEPARQRLSALERVGAGN